MKVCVLLTLCYGLTIYAYHLKPKQQCPGKCHTVRCGLYPVCEANETFVDADYDCICCPYCKPGKEIFIIFILNLHHVFIYLFIIQGCDPEICDRVDCRSPEDVEKRCIEEGLIYVKPNRETCNCCGDCIKKVK